MGTDRFIRLPQCSTEPLVTIRNLHETIERVAGGVLVFPISLFILLGATTGDGGAEAPSIAFDLFRAPGAERCPDRDALAARVGPQSFEAEAAHKPAVDRVSITIRRAPNGYVATVVASGLAGGMRSLVDDGEDCAGLTEALALALAMITDGQLIPPPHTAEAQPVAHALSRAARPWQLGASALASKGILGAPSAGMTLDVLWRPWPKFLTELSALWMPTRSIDGGGGSASFTLVAALASACGAIVPWGGRVLPAMCGEAAVGGLRGAGDGYAGARSVWAPWLVAGGSVELGVRLYGGMSLAARTGYLLSLRDAHFTVGGLGRVYDSGHPGWFAGLGVLVQIP